MKYKYDYLPPVSVVVPVYNAQDTIKPCVDSILNLTYPKDRVEFIFVDNYSTDSTAEILSTYSSDIKVFRESKRGAAAARNKGIVSASGEVIAFTDSDCVVDKDWLLEIVQPLKDDTTGISGGRILALHPCHAIEKAGNLIHNHKIAFSYDIPYAISMNWASRKDVLVNTGMFDENFLRAQDSEFSLRIFKAGYKLIYCHKAVIYHRNSKTYYELFYKGYLGGFFGVLLFKKHRKYYENRGVKRFRKERFYAVFDYLKKIVNTKSSSNHKYLFVHHLGRMVGMALGSLRFRFLRN